MSNEMREFQGGATRDTSNGKHDLLGFMHPLCDHSYAKYMQSHRLMSDGSLRDANNWWSGFGKDVPLQSLARHLEDLKILHSGWFAYEVKRDGKVERDYRIDRLDPLPDGYKELNEEECCNAIRFNSQAYLLEIIKK